MRIYKKSIILIFVLVIMITAGCAENPFLLNSSVAAMSTDCYISVNKDGTVNVVDKAGELGTDLSGWKDIKSVSAGLFYWGGIKKDGSVVITSYSGSEKEDEAAFIKNFSGFEDVSGWRNIKMIGFTYFTAYGLKDDGTIIFTSADSGIDDTIKEKVRGWTEIEYIDGLPGGNIQAA